MRYLKFVVPVLALLLTAAVPGGGGHEGAQGVEAAHTATVHHGTVTHSVDGVGVISVPGPAYAVAWWLTFTETRNVGQDIHTRWLDREGDEHTVVTHVNGTSYKLYGQRHLNLVTEMQRIFPKAP